MIHMKSVSKVYDNGTIALDHVNIDIAKGEFVFLVGASGAGKSTFIKLILKEIDAEKGTIRVNEREVNKLSNRQVSDHRRNIGIVFQDFRLPNFLQ